MNKLRISAYCLVFIFVLFTFSACTKAVNNSADELKLNKWSAQLDNGGVVTLSFSGDYATLKLTDSELKTYEISGLCEISATTFVIHDELTEMPFAFTYIVHFDSVEIVCDGNTVSLNKL
ncbi:MAG: hypothetical protein IJO20_02100 [Ruminococcus sp.]|nr:hypothetical protein [Ruminococcus sp.]